MKQDFYPKEPDLIWASDITYIKANGKWYYLCVVIDLFSRKVVGWELSGKADVDLVTGHPGKPMRLGRARLG